MTLVLVDPPSGQETWPLEDAFRLRREVRRVATEEFGISEYVSIVFAASVDFDVPGQDEQGGSDPERRA